MDLEGKERAVATEEEEEEEKTTAPEEEVPLMMSAAGGGGKGGDGEEEPGDESVGSNRNVMNNLVMLTENAQLQRLALLLRNNEEALMRRVIGSELERVQYLQKVNDSYRNAIRLLDDCTAFRDTYDHHEVSSSGAAAATTKRLIARDVHDYVKYGLNMCLQNVRNSCMRVDALAKLRSHYDALAESLAGGDNDGDLATLAMEAADYKASMYEYCYGFRSAAARARSRAYSQVLKLQGIELPDLLRTHQLKLGYGGKDFEDLEDAQKLDVYNSVIDESNRAHVQVYSAAHRQARIKTKTLAEAVSVFIMAVGNMVYDIYTNEHNVEQVLSASLNVLAAVGAFAVEAAVTSAVTKALASASLGLFATSLAGFVVGAVAGLIFVVVSGRLIDLIVGSPSKVPPIADLKFHTAVMPDGMALAIAISRG